MGVPVLLLSVGERSISMPSGRIEGRRFKDGTDKPMSSDKGCMPWPRGEVAEDMDSYDCSGAVGDPRAVNEGSMAFTPASASGGSRDC